MTVPASGRNRLAFSAAQRRHRHLLLSALWVCGLLQAPAGEAAEVQVMAIDRSSWAGSLAELTASSCIINSPQGPQVLPRGEVRRLTFGHAAEAESDGPTENLALWLTFTTGDELPVTSLTLADEQFAFQSPDFGPGTMPLDAVQSVRFTTEESPGRGESPVAGVRTDVVELRNGDLLRGTVNSLDADELSIETSLGTVRVPRESMVQLLLNPDLWQPARVPAEHQLIELVSGGWITAGRTLIDNAGQAAVQHPSGVDLHCQVTRIRSVSLYSDKLVSLVDRPPVNELSESYFGVDQPVMLNRNPLGEHLSIGGQRFLRGLGMTSQTRWTCALEAQDHTLLTEVGLDDAAGELGQLEMSIEVDGRPVWSSGVLSRVTGLVSVPPVSVAGAATLTLVVDFGPSADVQDLADWCDPVLVRSH